MSNPPTNRIVIVSGLPRSGTSMMMQMLERGGLAALTDGVRGADDDNPRGYYEFEPVKKSRENVSWLDQATGKAVKMVHLLLRDLPTDRAYSVILMRRHMNEVLASQTAMLERTGAKGATIGPEKLGAIFEQQMQKTVALLNDGECFDLLQVNYHDVVADPLAEAQRVNTFLGGGLDAHAMAGGVDPGLHRQKSASDNF